MSFIRTSRRRFFQNAAILAAGGSISSLLLSSRARAQEAFAQRALFMFSPHGAAYEYWQPRGSGADWDISYERCTLAPLAPLKDKICVLDGLDMKVLYEGGEDDGLIYSGHEGGMSAFLTGSKPVYLGPGTYVASGRSIDQEIADHLISRDIIRPHRSLELALGERSGTVTNDTINYGYGDGEESRIQGVHDPSVAFTRLFGDGDVENPEQLLRIVARKQSILDHVVDQIGRLSPTLTSYEREKLDQHLEGIRQIEQRLEGLAGGTCGANIAVEGLSLDPLSVNNIPAVAELHSDILAQAFACDLVRVATLQIGSGGADRPMPWLGIEQNPHQDLAHQIYGGNRQLNTDPNVLDPFLAMQTWYCEVVASVLTKLDAVTEENGRTILDNSLVVWGNELGDATVHGNVNIPMIVAGGAGVYEMGKHLVFSQSPNDSCAYYQGECEGDWDNQYQYLNAHNHVWVSVAQAFGMNIETFGDDRYVGPLPGL